MRVSECQEQIATSTSATPNSTAWHGTLLFTNSTRRVLDEALIAVHGISVKEFDVLITLFNAPEGRLRMAELAEQVVLSPSDVTHLVTRLERDGC